MAIGLHLYLLFGKNSITNSVIDTRNFEIGSNKFYRSESVDNKPHLGPTSCSDKEGGLSKDKPKNRLITSTSLPPLPTSVREKLGLTSKKDTFLCPSCNCETVWDCVRARITFFKK